MALKLGELATILSANMDPLKRDLAKGKQLVKEHGKDIQKAAMAAGALAGAAIGAGLLGALNIDAANAKLAASLGSTPAEAEKMGKIAGNLYADAWGQSMDEVTAAVGSVVSSIDGMRGATASDLEAMTKKALALATTFDLDVARAAQVAGQTVRSGLAGDATQAVDLLTASLQRVPTAIREDLLDAVDEYGPFMANIGITGEKAFGLLVQGAEKGMYGIDKTGDALKEFSALATDMSDRTGEAYKIIGLNQDKMSRDLVKGGEAGAKAFDQIVDALLKVKDPLAQQQAALALFGTPLEDLSIQDIPQFLASLDSTKATLGDVKGATDEMAETLQDNAAVSLEKFKRQAQGALVDAMVQALPLLTAVGGFLAEHSEIVVPLAGALATFAGVIMTVSGAMKAWAVIQAIMNLELWTCPITWIVALIVILVTAVVLIATKTDWFQRIWGAAWGRIKTAAKAVGDWFAGPFANFFKNTWDRITGWGSSALGWFKSLPGKLKSALSTVTSFVLAPFKAGFNAISRAWNATVGRLSWSIPGWVPGVGGNSISAPKLPQLARGGRALMPGLAIVGEAGPELAYMDQGAAIAPLGGGGGLSALTEAIKAMGQRGAEVLELTLDLGDGIREVVRVNLSEHDRQIKRRVLAGAGAR